MLVEPYIFYEGCCEEAVEFYKRAIGAQVEMMMRNKESPDQPPPGKLAPGSENKIMHCQFRVGETRILASDGFAGGTPKFEGFSLAITVATDAEAQRLFNGLKDGGQVRMPLTKTFFSSNFGMLVDRFGVAWMVMVGK